MTTKTGFVVRAERRGKIVYLRPCGAGSDKHDRSVDAKLFSTEEEAEAFGMKMSNPSRMGRVDCFSVHPETIHTLRLSENEREMIHQMLLHSGTEYQSLSHIFAK